MLRKRAISLGAAALLGAAPLLVRADGPSLPGPGRPHANAAAENTRCEGCHQEIAAEWRASLHKQAHTDAAYQRALAIEPLAFCRGCHAPEADPNTDPPPALGALGVGCVSCHGADGGVLAAPRDHAPAAPHGVVRAAAFAGAGACERCHEFSFPDPERRFKKELMQSTASEHRASPFAPTACAACHMPMVPDARGQHRSHRFAASRDPGLLRASARAVAQRVGDGEVEIKVAAPSVGHAFPTGDLFRRIEVRAEAVGPEANVVSEETRYLYRRFGKARGVDGHPIKVMLSDTRVPGGGESQVRLSLGAAARGRPIAWRVVYQRVAHPIDEATDAAVIEGEVEIASGVLR